MEGSGELAHRTVTKRELCESIASTSGCPQVVAKAIVQQFLDEIVEQLSQGNRIELRNFGVFATRVRAGNKARNPRTNETVEVPVKAKAHFKVGKQMADRVGQALRHVKPQ